MSIVTLETSADHSTIDIDLDEVAQAVIAWTSGAPSPVTTRPAAPSPTPAPTVAGTYRAEVTSVLTAALTRHREPGAGFAFVGLPAENILSTFGPADVAHVDPAATVKLLRTTHERISTPERAHQIAGLIDVDWAYELLNCLIPAMTHDEIEACERNISDLVVGYISGDGSLFAYGTDGPILEPSPAVANPASAAA